MIPFLEERYSAKQRDELLARKRWEADAANLSEALAQAQVYQQQQAVLARSELGRVLLEIRRLEEAARQNAPSGLGKPTSRQLERLEVLYPRLYVLDPTHSSEGLPLFGPGGYWERLVSMPQNGAALYSFPMRRLTA